MASRDVFVDTSGLYALVEKKDAHHVKTGEIVGKLIRAGKRLVVTDYVIAETVNLANARSGVRVGVRVFDLLEQSAGIRIEWVAPARFDATKAFFRRHADHGWSFTDCTSFIVMHELRLDQALTTDAHFQAAGFEALLVDR